MGFGQIGLGQLGTLRMHSRLALFVTGVVALAALSFSQQPARQLAAAASIPRADGNPAVTSAPAGYTLGAGDQLTVTVSDLDEFNDKTFRIDRSGNLNLPLAGRIHADGLTIDQLEAETAEHLRRIVKDPDVVIGISEFHSQPVSILGAVNTPGIRQLEGQKNLFEVLSLAGGLRPDAGYMISITRDLKWGRIPLPDAKNDSTGRFSIASLKVRNVMNGTHPAENITVMPGDTISVPKADLVYAVGSVTKPGGFPLGENETLSALQVVSLAEGLQKTAAGDKAKILRSVAGSSNRAEIAVNLKQLMAGRAADIPLQSNDILFIPNSAAKSATYRSLEAVIQAASGVAVYGRY